MPTGPSSPFLLIDYFVSLHDRFYVQLDDRARVMDVEVGEHLGVHDAHDPDHLCFPRGHHRQHDLGVHAREEARVGAGPHVVLHVRACHTFAVRDLFQSERVGGVAVAGLDLHVNIST